MPKAKKSDGFDVLLDAFALAPWWVPLFLAVLAWFLIPRLGPESAPGKSWQSTWHVVAYFAALVWVLTGIGGQLERQRRRQLVAEAKSLEGFQTLGWRQFEQVCAPRPIANEATRCTRLPLVPTAVWT